MKYVFSVVILLTALSLHAQQPPDIQQNPIWASGKKIDGNLADWGAALAAYNATNKIWYAIANDNDYIYLAIKKTDNLAKIYAPASIQFYVSANGDRKTEQLPMLHFPVTTEGIHKKLPEKWDEIAVRNIPAIKDSLISIYNQYGIKAAWKLDAANNVFTSEIRIPRKLLALNGNAFDYNICLMGTGRRGQPSMFLMTGIQLKNKDGKALSPAELLRLAETDTVTEFWATYHFANQP